VETDNAQGNFNRCDVIVHPPSKNSIDIKLGLENGPPDQIEGMTTVKVGPVTLYRYLEKDNDCDRAIAMVDRTTVWITSNPRGPLPGVCTYAELAAQDALKAIARGELPRRTVPINRASLGSLDACTILNTSAMSNVLGVPLRQDSAGFGGWRCEWNTADNNVNVKVIFDRGNTLEDGKATKAGRRAAVVQPRTDGDFMCQVNFAYRTTTDQNGDRIFEIIQVWLYKDDVAGDKLCPAAQQVATAMSAHI
jgi:hypothetical protein